MLDVVTFSSAVKNIEINNISRANSVNNKVSFFHLGWNIDILNKAFIKIFLEKKLILKNSSVDRSKSTYSWVSFSFCSVLSSNSSSKSYIFFVFNLSLIICILVLVFLSNLCGFILSLIPWLKKLLYFLDILLLLLLVLLSFSSSSFCFSEFNSFNLLLSDSLNKLSISKFNSLLIISSPVAIAPSNPLGPLYAFFLPPKNPGSYPLPNRLGIVCLIKSSLFFL